MARCPGLRTIDLQRCFTLTDAAVVALSKWSDTCEHVRLNTWSSKKLRTVNLATCQVSDEGVTALARSCKEITHLGLQCTHVTDKGALFFPYSDPENHSGVAVVASALGPGLKSVDLSCCQERTPDCTSTSNDVSCSASPIAVYITLQRTAYNSGSCYCTAAQVSLTTQ